MFENRINSFTPNIGAPIFTPGFFPGTGQRQAMNLSPMAVQIDSIYKAAAQRAVEEHEIDKLFNAEFYNDDYQI
jgi:hypothetical protein